MEKEKDKIIKKITKLLELGTSPNQAEAELAMKRAGELMAKHSLAQDDITQKTEAVTDIRLPQLFDNRKTAKWEVYLAMAIAKNFHCKVIHKVSREEDETKIHIFGETQDLKIVLHFYFFLHSKLQEEANQKSINSKNRGSFYHGIIDIIRGRLLTLYNERKRILNDKHDAIVYDKQAKVDKSVKSIYPQLSSGRAPNYRMGDSFKAGQGVGRNINLFQPIREQKGTKQLS